MNTMENNYFNWMVHKLFHDEDLMIDYSSLLIELDSIPFEWVMEMDENRQKDGRDLRYIFGDEMSIHHAIICQHLDYKNPSVLEVIVALIIRIQENMLYDPVGNNLNQEIFMDILTSLQLDGIKGELTPEISEYIHDVIYNFHNRNYDYYGKGGLFTVNNPKNDMRYTEIWFQFMWYLDEKLGGKYL